jgi:predicted O-methyltransferase YrrM
MQINKEIVDNLIYEFTLSENKNTIEQKHLSKFIIGSKKDDLYLSIINSKDEHYITFLNFIIKKLKPKNIVELGNREGLSTLAMYDATKKVDADFFSIDIEKDLRYCPDHMFSDPKMHFLFGDVCSLDIIKQIPKNIDILFTDTLHFDFQVRDEWEIYQHLLSDKALVAIDDININDKRKLFDKVQYPKWDLTELCHHNGWGLFLFERNETVTNEQTNMRLYESISTVWERKYESLFKIFNAAQNKKVLPTLKNLVKKIKPAYKAYTYLYNNLNKKFNKANTMNYSGSTRL